MAYIQKLKDAEVGPWVEKFNTAAATYSAELDLTPDDLTTLNDTATKFKGKYSASEAAKSAAADAVQAKDEERENLNGVYMEFTNKIQALNPPDHIKAALGITIRDTEPTPLLPYRPEELTADPTPTGDIFLNWKRGQNKPNMQFVIEYRTKANPEFTMLDIITATRYTHKGHTPGEFIAYRIKARKGDRYSEPSNEAAVYVEDA